ncbi:MAG: hypothetical protein IJ092_05130 [Atopobiaceae bacterium]|nr:hypothetical protein [Atopobiaceae bacterium]
MASRENPLMRLLPAALGLVCATLLTITLVTCSGVADRALSDWVPSNEYGERAFEVYTLVSEDSDTAPKLRVAPPEWVIGVATEDAPEGDLSRSHTHLTYTFATGNVVLTYATDNVDDFLAWQLSEDTIITSHLFGGRYTNIVVGQATHAEMGGHDVSWGTYSFDDEYGRRNTCFASAAEVGDGQVLTIVATENAKDGEQPFLDEASLTDLWEGIAWQ